MRWYVVVVQSAVNDDSSCSLVDRLHRWTKWFRKTNTVSYSLIIWSLNRCVTAMKSLTLAVVQQGPAVFLYIVVLTCVSLNSFCSAHTCTHACNHFWATVCKMVCLCYWSIVFPVCLSVCNVRALWPNRWTDQDETWHAGRPRPWPHCVRWWPSSPSPKGAQPPIFGAYLLRPNGCMDQDVTWYEARPRPRRLCVRWEPRSPSPKGAEPPNFRPMSIVAKALDGSRCHLVWR